MDGRVVPFRTSAPDAPAECGLTYNANAGSARTKGIECQARLAVTDSLRADFGGSYIDAKLTEDAQTLGAFSGDRLPGRLNTMPMFRSNTTSTPSATQHLSGLIQSMSANSMATSTNLRRRRQATM